MINLGLHILRLATIVIETGVVICGWLFISYNRIYSSLVIQRVRNYIYDYLTSVLGWGIALKIMTRYIDIGSCGLHRERYRVLNLVTYLYFNTQYNSGFQLSGLSIYCIHITPPKSPDLTGPTLGNNLYTKFNSCRSL